MATIVHNTTADKDTGERSGTGWIVALIVLLAVVLLFLFAGAFFTNNTGTTPINTPAADNGYNVNGSINGSVSGPSDAGGAAQ